MQPKVRPGGIDDPLGRVQPGQKGDVRATAGFPPKANAAEDGDTHKSQCQPRVSGLQFCCLRLLLKQALSVSVAGPKLKLTRSNGVVRSFSGEESVSTALDHLSAATQCHDTGAGSQSAKRRILSEWYSIPPRAQAIYLRTTDASGPVLLADYRSCLRLLLTKGGPATIFSLRQCLGSSIGRAVDS